MVWVGFVPHSLAQNSTFFPVKTNKLLTPKGQSEWTCTNEVQKMFKRSPSNIFKRRFILLKTLTIIFFFFFVRLDKNKTLVLTCKLSFIKPGFIPHYKCGHCTLV